MLKGGMKYIRGCNMYHVNVYVEQMRTKDAL